MTEKRILAIDPANRTGWAYARPSDGRLFAGVWDLVEHPSRHPGDRLLTLRWKIEAVLREFPMDIIACENAPLGGGLRNVHTAVMHAELIGVVKMAAAQFGAQVWLVNPQTLKSFAGCAGKAARSDKSAMIRACERLLRVKTTDDNIADALFILEWARVQKGPPVTKHKARRKNVRGKEPRLFK